MKRETANAADTLLFVALSCAFAASALLVLLLGTRVYKSIAAAADLTYGARVCTSYVAEKLRHGNQAGAVSIGVFDGGEALILESTHDAIAYTTLIYHEDGWLWELFCEKGAPLTRQDGTKIIGVDSLCFSEVKPGVFSIEAVGADGKKSSLCLTLRSGG